MRYLSPEWFAAAQQALADDDSLRELSAGLDFCVEQTVVDVPDTDDGVVRWHIGFDNGHTKLVMGAAPEADVRFRAAYPTAVAIAKGELAAAIAFIRGEMTVGGDLDVLTAHQRALAALDDVLAKVRLETTYD